MSCAVRAARCALLANPPHLQVFFASPGTGKMPADARCAQAPDDEFGDGLQHVWSMYSLSTTIPNAESNWAWDTPAVSTTCSDVPFANCYSFSCAKIDSAASGVELASCTCALNENINGKAVDPEENAIFTKGSCDSVPVGYAEPMDGGASSVPDASDAAFLRALLGASGRGGGASSTVN